MNNEKMTIFRYEQGIKRLFVCGSQDIGMTDHGVDGYVDNYESIESMFEEVLREGVPAERTLIREKADGSSTLEVSFLPEFGLDGRMMSVIGIAREKNSGNGKSMIEKLEDEKRALMKEIFHRVNNNLQIIESLLRLQADRSGDPKYLDMMGGYIDRIHAIAMIQKRMYRDDGFPSLNFADFVTEFIGYIRGQYPGVAERVEIVQSVDGIELGIDTAIPCALILNELVENSLKHAFPGGRNGFIEIIFRLYGQYCVLEVTDNGIGFNADALGSRQDGFGLELVRILTGQLRGSAVFNDPGGACCTIAFRHR